MRKKWVALVLGLLLAPVAAGADTYSESFECTFGKGLVNKPTPSRIVFSVDQFGRSVRLHEIEIPEIDTNKGTGRVKSDTPRRLSIAWVGNNYVFSESGRSYASNESRIDALDLHDQEFSVFLDRKTMKAIARSTSLSAYLPRDGFAKGRCTEIAAPKN